MEPIDQEKAALISDIEADARAEAEGIVQDAEARAADKRKYGEKQVESLLKEAANQAEQQRQAIRNKADADADREVRRRLMHLRAAVVQGVLDRVKARLSEMVSQSEYRNALVNWIAEAAVGLDADEAEVNASAAERGLIDDALLAEAADAARTAAGRGVSLRLSNAEPLRSQGVVLTAADGRTAFNNQVHTRLRRHQREIQTMIQDTLFSGSRDEQA